MLPPPPRTRLPHPVAHRYAKVVMFTGGLTRDRRRAQHCTSQAPWREAIHVALRRHRAGLRDRRENYPPTTSFPADATRPAPWRLLDTAA
jgi:hypothetical protein